jgi:hypothetical protein
MAKEKIRIAWTASAQKQFKEILEYLQNRLLVLILYSQE